MILGCDISHWNGAVDFPRMRAAGVRFVFIKASDEFLPGGRDDHFRYNWGEARRAGILAGPYHYYRKGYSPQLQAGNFFQAVAETNWYGDLPPVVDFEEPDSAYNLKAFLDWVRNLFGCRPIIYTSSGKWFNPSPVWTYEYDLWVASYTTNPSPSMPAGWQDWKFWQKSRKGDGHFYGVESYDLDMNWWYGSEAELYAYANTEPPPVKAPNAAKVLVSSLNIRSSPDSTSIQNIVAMTSLGKVIAVESAVQDGTGKTWYQVGRGLFLAAWLCEAVG